MDRIAQKKPRPSTNVVDFPQQPNISPHLLAARDHILQNSPDVFAFAIPGGYRFDDEDGNVVAYLVLARTP